MNYFDIIKILLYIGSASAIPQLLIMAHQKQIHPEKLKQIQRITKWLNYQLVGCGAFLGLVIKLSW